METPKTGEVSSASAAFVAGITAAWPLLPGVVPLGMVYGATARGAGLSVALTAAMSAVVFSGSAQFVATQLIAAGTPGTMVVFTTLIMNLRHLLYSASMAPYAKGVRSPWRWLMAYLLTDEAYAMAIGPHRQAAATHLPWYFLGVGSAVWGGWQSGTLLGALLGARVPAHRELEFTLPLTFMAILAPALRSRASVAAAATAGSVAVLTADLPLGLGFLLAALAGVGVGLPVSGAKAHASDPGGR
jgi:4-azaleucine resistance transporter AzlC